MRIQAALSDAVRTVEIFPGYAEGLADLDGFDHLILPTSKGPLDYYDPQNFQYRMSATEVKA